jgi:osmoprotectant transport system substrate-binding protein
LDKHSEVRTALERLGGRLSAEEMRRLNYAVDGEKQDASRVVSDFLTRKNFFAANISGWQK